MFKSLLVCISFQCDKGKVFLPSAHKPSHSLPEPPNLAAPRLVPAPVPSAVSSGAAHSPWHTLGHPVLVEALVLGRSPFPPARLLPPPRIPWCQPWASIIVGWELVTKAHLGPTHPDCCSTHVVFMALEVDAGLRSGTASSDGGGLSPVLHAPVCLSPSAFVAAAPSQAVSPFGSF